MVMEPPWPPGQPEPPIFTEEWWALFAERVKKGWWAPFVGLILAMSGALEAGLMWLASSMLTQITGIVGRLIMGVFSITTMSGFHTLVKRSGKEATNWMKEAADTFRTPPSEWLPFINTYFENITGISLDPNAFKEIKIGPSYQKTMQALGHGLLDPMLGLIMPGYGKQGFPMGLTPEDGMAAAERFLGANAQFQFSAWLLHMLGDVFSFGMWKAMKDLPNAISWSYGIGWLSWIVMGTPFRMGIAEPLEILYNRLYRPYRIPLAKVADMFWRGHKDLPWLMASMRDWGVKDQDMAAFLAMERVKMSSAEVYNFYRMGKMTFEQLEAYQRDQGHSPAESHSLATEMTRRKVRDLLGDVAMAAEKHYQDRRMDGSQLRSFLAQADFTPEEATLEIQRLNLLMALEKPEELAERVLTPANIGRLYQLGYKTRQWAEVMLTKRGFKTDELADYLLLYIPKEEKVPEPKEPSAGLVGWLYQRGMIPLSEAKARWRDLDLPPDYISLLTMRYAPPEPPPPPPPREFSPTEVGRLYQEHYLILAEALRRLQAEPIRMKKDDAQMYLEAFYKPIEPVEPPPKEAPVSVVGNLYKQGQITLEVFREYLDLLNYSRSAKEFLIKTYTPPPEVPPPPVMPLEFQPSTIGRLYHERGITREEALARLTTITPPMTMWDAILFLDTLYTPEEEE